MIKSRSVSASLRAIFICAAAMLCACAAQQPAVSTSLQQTSSASDAIDSVPVESISDGQQAAIDSTTDSTTQPQLATQPVEEAEVRAPVKGQDVVWIQERLQSLGYYNGAIDGAVGQATRSAIEVYQQDQGVTPDGEPTAELREFMWRNGG